MSTRRRRGAAALLFALVPTAALYGCGMAGGSDVLLGDDDAGDSAGPGEAPTGQTWEQVVDDKGCGREGVTYVLVDEVCGGQGNGYDAPKLQAPMFRDGALFGSTLLAVDATHLWGLDLRDRTNIQRNVLLSGLGQPVAAAAHGNELLLAAGERGLLRLDATDPAAPSLTRAVALGGFAHDVALDGERATVALGRAGVGLIDLSTDRITTIPVPGYAAGAITRGNYAYVAACDSLAVVDVAAQQVVGRTWTPYAMDGAVLGAAAKDVALVGDVAFVAAGKHGAVAIDVADPAAPRVLGNCTLDEPSFYASGVRAQDDTLFIAGGEYGILTVDVSDPRAACGALHPPATNLPPPQSSSSSGGSSSGETTCSTEPPWEVMPWEQIWAPPPPAKDPIQVLPGGDVVYAFGDARRIGTRAVDVRTFATADLPLVGRYDEPRRALGVAASGARVLVVGSRGGLFQWQDDALVRTPNDRDADIRAATAGVFTGGGRWVLLRDHELLFEGATTPYPLGNATYDAIAPMGTNSVAVAGRDGLLVVDIATGLQRPLPSLRGSTLPLSLAASNEEVFVAAPEWTTTVRALPSLLDLPAHGVFDEEDALDSNLWRQRLPRRQLLATGQGLAEAAVLGSHAGLVLHRATGGELSVTLPAATYVAGAADANHVYLTSIDRSHYRSALATVTLQQHALQLESVEVFSGAAAGVAAAGGHVFVADADGALRVYDVQAGAPALVSLVSLEDLP